MMLTFMRIGSPEYWTSHDEKQAVRKLSYAEQITAIETKLVRGTQIIKSGHQVLHLNPQGIEIEAPLSKRQIGNLDSNLRVLRERLTRR